MKGVLLAGGKGTRLRPITHTAPKQLVPVANKPVLQYAIEDMADAGITEIGVVLGNKGRREIQEFLGDGERFGVDVTYIVQGDALGLAHATGCARDFVDGDDFVLYLGDDIVESDITGFVEEFREGDYDASVALKSVEEPSRYGIADVADDGTVARLVEKPADPPTDLALIGIYAFTPRVFEAIEAIEPSWRGELEITDAIQWLLDDGGRVAGHRLEGWWRDTGKPEDVLEANELALADAERDLRGTVEDEKSVEGPVELGEGSVVEAGAFVRGPVSIGENTRIGKGAYVGPYASIGDDCVVERARIEHSVVVGESEITCEETIVESLIGRKATIRPNETEQTAGERFVVGKNASIEL